jgi:hypothetical protein
MDATWAGSSTCQTLQIPLLPWQPLKFLQLMQRGKAGAIGVSWRLVQHGTPPVPIWRCLRRKKNSSLRHQPPSKASGNTLGNGQGRDARQYSGQYRGQQDRQYSEPIASITLHNQLKANSETSQVRAIQLPKQSSATRTTTSPTRAESASRAGKPEATTTSTDKQAPF